MAAIWPADLPAGREKEKNNNGGCGKIGERKPAEGKESRKIMDVRENGRDCARFWEFRLCGSVCRPMRILGRLIFEFHRITTPVVDYALVIENFSEKRKN